MFKKLLILVLVNTSLFLSAQTAIEKELKILETPEQAENYLKTKKSKKNKLITFNEEKHNTILAKELFKLGVGGTKIKDQEFEKTFYKVIKKRKNIYNRVSYIYLDGSKYSLEDINTLRDKIITKFNNGASFNFLAKQYSMDEKANKGGDLGWYLKGEMHTDFENEIANHSLNDIFTIDIPETNWYYVVLKTHDPKKIVEVDVLKIVETKY